MTYCAQGRRLMIKLMGIELRAGELVAAFFGSIILAILMKEKNPFRILSIVFIGIFTSIFFSPYIYTWLPSVGDVDAAHNAAGAIAGIGGMAIMNGIIGVVGKVMLATAGAAAAKVEEKKEAKA